MLQMILSLNATIWQLLYTNHMNINVLPHHPNKQQIMNVLSEEVIIAVIRQKEKGDNPEYDSMKNTKKLMSQSSKHA